MPKKLPPSSDTGVGRRKRESDPWVVTPFCFSCSERDSGENATPTEEPTDIPCDV